MDKKGGEETNFSPLSDGKKSSGRMKKHTYRSQRAQVKREINREKLYMQMTLGDAEYQKLYKKWSAEFANDTSASVNNIMQGVLSFLDEKQKAQWDPIFREPASREIAPCFFASPLRCKNAQSLNALLDFLILYVDSPEFTMRISTMDSISFFLSFTSISPTETKKIQRRIRANVTYGKKRKQHEGEKK